MKFVCFVVAAFSMSSLCCAEDAHTPVAVLKSYEEYLTRLRIISFSSRFQDRVEEKSAHFTNEVSQTWKLDFAGKRLWRTSDSRVIGDPSASPSPRSPMYSETLLAPDKLYEVAVDRKSKVAQSFTGFIKIPDDYWSTRTGFGYLSYPFGYIQDGRDYKYIPDMIRENAALERQGSVVVLSCKLKTYDIRIHLNPEKEWMAERIDYTAGDVAHPHVSSYTVERSSQHQGVWFPELYHCKSARPAESQKLPPNFRMINGNLVIVDKGSKEGQDFIQKSESTLVSEVTLSNIHFNGLSDADFQLQATVPNGTAVHMQDALHLDYAWLDGQIVPRPNELLIAKSDAKFLGGSRASWLIFANLAVLFGALLVYTYRKMRKSRT